MTEAEADTNPLDAVRKQLGGSKDYTESNKQKGDGADHSRRRSGNLRCWFSPRCAGIFSFAA
jgi:hypothetical protein